MNPTPPAPTSDTRDRILDAAERLFVEHGFDGTSMRMITGAANANLAAVNYHFGSKDALVQEVFRRRLADLNERRIAALDRLEATHDYMLLVGSAQPDAWTQRCVRNSDEMLLVADAARNGSRFLRRRTAGSRRYHRLPDGLQQRKTDLQGA